MSSIPELRPTPGKILNRSNHMTLGVYEAAVVREYAITLFGTGWNANYYKDWEFIPTENGRFYTIKLAGFNVAMTRANNPNPANNVWALYGNPLAMTDNYVAGVPAQEWIIRYVGEYDEDTNIVTIHPRQAPDEVLAVGEAGLWQPPWCSTKLRKAEKTHDQQWLIPA